jgi:hypothetical protein
MLYDLFSSRSKLRAHVVRGKPVEESVQHSRAGKDKAYSMTRYSFGGATVKARLKGAAIRIEIERCDKCDDNAERRPVDHCRYRRSQCDRESVIEKILKHPGLDEASQAGNRSPPTSLFDHSTQLF